MNRNTVSNTSIAIDEKTAKRIKAIYNRQEKAIRLLELLEEFYKQDSQMTMTKFFTEARKIAGIKV